MKALKLGRLPERNAVKKSVVLDPDLNRELELYATLYRNTYGEAETVETFVPNKRCDSHIQQIISNSNQHNYYGLYSKLWLQSKYGSSKDLFQTMVDTERSWVPHERLGRLVASFLPVFYNTAEEVDFRSLLNRTLNSGVREAYKFHINLSQDAGTFKDMFMALKAPNMSRGTGTTHAKFLCLLSALRNPVVPAAQIAVLKAKNALAFKDAYYKRIAKRAKAI
jgi:hypothetical protein